MRLFSENHVKLKMKMNLVIGGHIFIRFNGKEYLTNYSCKPQFVGFYNMVALFSKNYSSELYIIVIGRRHLCPHSCPVN